MMYFQLIQTGSYVALTVVHSSRFTGLAGGQEGGQAEITGPSPPNNDAERRFHSDKVANSSNACSSLHPPLCRCTLCS